MALVSCLIYKLKCRYTGISQQYIVKGGTEKTILMSINCDDRTSTEKDRMCGHVNDTSC